jgi:hypothetical protein
VNVNLNSTKPNLYDCEQERPTREKVRKQQQKEKEMQ